MTALIHINLILSLEISHPDLRGSLAAFPSIFLALGITNVSL